MRNVALMLSCVVAALGPNPAAAADPVREEAVRAKGATVMPFALANTQHEFEKDQKGGVQRVLAKPGHAEEVAPIRAHLREIADQFARRDFSGPAKIHGEDMPGLAELRAASAEDLRVAYAELPDGAEVRYVGNTPAITDAIHRWFDAQVSDHGHDASDHLSHHHHGG